MVVTTEKKRQIVDITSEVEKFVNDKNNGNLCFVFIKHTTAAITTADLDPGTDLDMLDAFDVLIPKLKFRHPHDPSHVPDHILSSIIGTSISIPVIKGKLDLGTWQRIVLVELDGPRSREIVITLL
jgi:secondary thiamine-phosphate synthase enzyme